MRRVRTSPHLREADTSSIALPRMALYASCLMLPILFFLYNYGSQRTEMGIISSQKLPVTHIIACKGPTEFAVISLNEQGQFAFSVSGVSPQVQTAAIQAVAHQRGISLSTEQLKQLESLPFLATDIDELPKLLSLPYHRRGYLVELARFKPISEVQVVACAVAARQFDKTLFHRPISISLRIETEANSGKVMRLVEQLQARGFTGIHYQNQFL